MARNYSGVFSNREINFITSSFKSRGGTSFLYGKQNKTASRPNLDPQETLGSILTVKLALKGEEIYKMDMPNDILTRAKKDTWECNKADSSINQ